MANKDGLFGFESYAEMLGFTNKAIDWNKEYLTKVMQTQIQTQIQTQEFDFYKEFDPRWPFHAFMEDKEFKRRYLMDMNFHVMTDFVRSLFKDAKEMHDAQEDRCNNCQHLLTEFHRAGDGAGGCWFTLTSGKLGNDLGCQCTNENNSEY
jgi:hypothetical protein